MYCVFIVYVKVKYVKTIGGNFGIKIHFSFFLIYFLLLFNYSCTPFLPFPPPTAAEPNSLPHPHPPLDFVHVSFTIVPAIPSFHCPHLTTPWPLLDSSPPQCLWWYFGCFFLLLIMFQLKV